MGAAGETPTMGVVVESRTDTHSTCPGEDVSSPGILANSLPLKAEPNEE